MSKDLSAKFYQNNNQRLQKKAQSLQRYQNLSKEEKKQQYGREQYKDYQR